MRIKILFSLIFIMFKLYGQENAPDFEKILDYLLPAADEEVDLDVLNETLFNMYDHPVL